MNFWLKSMKFFFIPYIGSKMYFRLQFFFHGKIIMSVILHAIFFREFFVKRAHPFFYHFANNFSTNQSEQV